MLMHTCVSPWASTHVQRVPARAAISVLNRDFLERCALWVFFPSRAESGAPSAHSAMASSGIVGQVGGVPHTTSPQLTPFHHARAVIPMGTPAREDYWCSTETSTAAQRGLKTINGTKPPPMEGLRLLLRWKAKKALKGGGPI